MKAIYMENPTSYTMVDRPDPKPGTNEALIRVERAGLCHTDVIIRSGTASHVRYPVIPGHEFSGIVESVGSAVKNVKPGDRVAVCSIVACHGCDMCRRNDTMRCRNSEELGSKRNGGFAEYCTIPSEYLFVLPSHVSLEEAALIEPLANGISAITQAETQIGEKIVIVGPGPIGLLTLQVAKLYSPKTLLLVGTRNERLTLGKQLGATHVVNINDKDYLKTIDEILVGEGADVVVNCASTDSAMVLSVDIAGWRGRVAVEGYLPEETRIPIRQLQVRANKIIGICGWSTSNFAEAFDLLGRGLVQTKPLISHTLSLDEWEEGFSLITERKSEAMKVLLAP